MEALVRFMRAVPRKSRKSVLKKFAALAHDKLGMIDVEVSTPSPLSSEQLSALSEGIRRSLKTLEKNPVVSVKLDGSLLGGVRVIAGNRMTDYSIRRKISRLRGILRGKVVST
jgi:F0F1-type ATP synthase delta subunit